MDDNKRSPQGYMRHGGVFLTVITAGLIIFSQFAQMPASSQTAIKSIKVTAQGFEFLPGSRIKSFGRLKWRGGLILRSSSSDFGGFSGIIMDPKGDRFLAVSDRGKWLRGSILYRGTRPLNVTATSIGPLLNRKGGVLRSKNTSDAEAIALISGNLTKGSALIGFERLHRVGRFSISEKAVGAPRYIRLPGRIRRLSRNSGIEALDLIRAGPMKGALLVFAERLRDNKGNLRGWLIGGPRPGKIKIKRRDGFDITDLAALPNGDVLILERRYRKPKSLLFDLINVVKMRIRLVRAKHIRAGAVLDGEVLIEANRKYTIDNMEGIAVHRSPEGETVITLISDDNFNFLQRTLLMQFTLPDEK